MKRKVTSFRQQKATLTGVFNVQRRKSECLNLSGRIVRLEVASRCPQGRPKRRICVVKRGHEVGVKRKGCRGWAEVKANPEGNSLRKNMKSWSVKNVFL